MADVGVATELLALLLTSTCAALVCSACRFVDFGRYSNPQFFYQEWYRLELLL